MSIAVIIATYNRPALLLERALASALRQTHRVDEIIVVGDGTDDETVREMEAMEHSDRRISFTNLPHQQYPDDGGESRWCLVGIDARNYGLDIAKSEWVMILDDDDALEDDAIEVLLGEASAFRDGGQASCVYGMSKYHWPNGHPQTAGKWPPGHFNLCLGSAIWRAEYHMRLDNACVSRGLPGDGDLWDRMVISMGLDAFRFVPRIVHHYYVGARDWK